MAQEISREEAIRRVQTIDGWLGLREIARLYDLAKKANGPIVEIGSWQGRSTAALALGSMAGNSQPVFAIDSFAGVPPYDRKTALGQQPGWKSSSPEILRANLDRVGVNGLVRIIAQPSQKALPEIPQCAVLFVDGDHSFSAANADLAEYLPLVAPGGSAMIHDCWEHNPGVIQAFGANFQPQNWRVTGRVESAIVIENRSTKRHSVLMTFPGKSMVWGVASGIMQCTLGAHDICFATSGFGWDDMDILWTQGLNAALIGECTHMAMLHSDVCPTLGWIDMLLSELDDHQADYISATVALKSTEGLTSCGVGDWDNPWQPHRRFTVRETLEFPETFSIADTPHPDKFLLHNSGCWVADLRNPAWRTVDEEGNLVVYFDFPQRARLESNGSVTHLRESEDWFFSRRMAQVGLKTLGTTKVETTHIGPAGFPNYEPWGKFKNGDDDTRSKWGAKL